MHNPIRTWWLKHQAKVIAPYLQQIEGFKVQRENDRRLIETQRTVLKELRDGQDMGTLTIERVMKRGIEYYDSTSLPHAEQVTYRVNAEEVLRNPTLANEIRRLEADWVLFAAKEAKDYDTVRDMRMCINALELLQERLSCIPDPRKKELNTDPFDAI